MSKSNKSKTKKQRGAARKGATPKANSSGVWIGGGAVCLVGALIYLTFFNETTSTQKVQQTAPASIPTVTIEISDPAVAATIEGAINVLNQGIESDENWGTLGMIYLVNGFRKEGQLAFAEAFRLQPLKGMWRYLEGICYFPDDMAKGLKLLKESKELIEKNGNSEEQLAVQRRVGNVMLENGNFEDAENIFNQILKQLPNNEAALLGLGLIRNNQGRFSEAKTFLEQCDQHRCTRKRAKQALAAAMRGLGDLDAAQALLQEVESIPPDMDWLDPFVALASAHRSGLEALKSEIHGMMNNRRFLEASELVDQVINDYSESPFGYLVKAELLMRQGDLKTAVSNLQTALKLDDQNFQVWIQLGIAQGNQNDLEGAITSFDKAIALSPTFGEAHYNRGFSLLSLKRDEEALKSFEAAIRFQPELPDAYIAVAQIYEERAELEKAKEYLGRALEVSPDDVRARIALSRISKDATSMTESSEQQ